MEDKDINLEELSEDGVEQDINMEAHINSEIEETVEDDTDCDNEEVSSEEVKSSKSFFKKEKKEKKDKKDLKIDELNDRLLRSVAEFDNFRKRSEKEKARMFEIGARDIIERILPVIDNFERGLGTLTEEEKENAFAQGIDKIYRQLFSTLEEAGLKPIETIGKEFDPNLHNAVMHSEDPEQGDNIIAEEFQKGYIYKDTVVRHSMVKVVN